MIVGAESKAIKAMPNLPEHCTLYRQALLIRSFEQTLLDLFRQGEIAGTVHTCIGQEFTGLAVARCLRGGDTVFSNHRGHGHFLARTGDVIGLLAEIMGRSRGVCGGLGGSQHLYAPGFYSNGIQGGMVPIAAGHALAQKIQQSRDISVAFIGDGTLGEGVLYESLNIASKWRLPLLLVVENNGIAQTTPTDQALAGTIEGRAGGFDVAYYRADTSELANLLDETANAVGVVRDECRPAVLEICTYRLMAHSKGDDTRPIEEIEAYRQRDSLNRFLAEHPDLASELHASVDAEIDAALFEARQSPVSGQVSDNGLRPRAGVRWQQAGVPQHKERVVAAIYHALSGALLSDSRLVLLGQDLHAPYGGAFKVTRDLSERFPGRVISTPISEAAQVGIGTGLALAGMLPVVEVMFGDFIGLGFDQLLNHASKFPFMYGGKVEAPIVVRVPMGGKRGYGPTHSQTLEKHLLGIPYLDIIALHYRVSPRDVYARLLTHPHGPTVVIENKVLYTAQLAVDAPDGFAVQVSDERYPTIRIRPAAADRHLTLFCYGEMLEECEKAVAAAFDEDEILCEIICPTQIQPLNIEPVIESVQVTDRLLTVEEGIIVGGVGAEVIARLADSNVPLKWAGRLGSTSLIPSCRELEKQIIPDMSAILSMIRAATHG